jgi:hypothetical protein
MARSRAQVKPFRRGRGAAPIRHLAPSTLAAFSDMRPLPDKLRSDPSDAAGDALGMPVLAENDANLAALGEAVMGAGRAHRSIVFVALNDGIGAGIVSTASCTGAPTTSPANWHTSVSATTASCADAGTGAAWRRCTARPS